MNRNALRKTSLAVRDVMEQSMIRKKSGQIHSLLREHPMIISANHIFIYVHFRSEVETMSLITNFIAAGKIISVPVTLLKESRIQAVQLSDPQNQLQPGCYGIPEPISSQITEATVDPATIDIVLIPGSVFDKNGGRLGYGGGFYDRFLYNDAPGAIRVGLAYELQIVDRVPMQPHDQYMDFLISEQRIYDCKRDNHA